MAICFPSSSASIAQNWILSIYQNRHFAFWLLCQNRALLLSAWWMDYPQPAEEVGARPSAEKLLSVGPCPAVRPAPRPSITVSPPLPYTPSNHRGSIPNNRHLHLEKGRGGGGGTFLSSWSLSLKWKALVPQSWGGFLRTAAPSHVSARLALEGETKKEQLDKQTAFDAMNRCFIQQAMGLGQMLRHLFCLWFVLIIFIIVIDFLGRTGC